MRNLFILLKERLQSNYWFYPSAMFLVSIVAAWVTVEIDSRRDNAEPLFYGHLFFHNLSVETARVYLSTLAGAIITVAGVVFSLTMLMVSSASGQFGPRILNNFMRDKFIQLVLGMYTATFVYCSTVLLSLSDAGPDAFAPLLSVFCSYVLALLCVGLLILYIHHIPASLRVEDVLRRLARSAFEMMDLAFPKDEGVELKSRDEIGDSSQVLKGEWEAEVCHSCGEGEIGYVQAVDLKELVAMAQKFDAIFELKVSPGEFLNGKEPFVLSNRELNEAQVEELVQAFVVGGDRTLAQNLMYVFSQLMEVGIRAMSPSVNDPITAMSCVDWLEACLLELMEKDTGEVFALDERGRPRVLLAPLGPEEVLFQARKGLAEHMGANYATAMHFLEALQRLFVAARRQEHRDAIKACAAALFSFYKRKDPTSKLANVFNQTFSSFQTNPVQ